MRGKGMEKLFREPKNVPIRLYPKGIWDEILYAGALVPAKGGRISGGLRYLQTGREEADYSGKDFGPLAFAHFTAPVVGTHGVLAFQERKDGKEKEIYLRAIAVPEQFQGSGIAQKMLDRLVRIARARGHDRIVLWTREKTRAHSFFVKNGFRFLRYDEMEPRAISRRRVKLVKFVKASAAKTN
jgi:GNAT superfamily N-acetyltransferase